MSSICLPFVLVGILARSDGPVLSKPRAWGRVGLSRSRFGFSGHDSARRAFADLTAIIGQVGPIRTGSIWSISSRRRSAALDALPAVTVQRLHPQSLPPWAARDPCGMPFDSLSAPCDAPSLVSGAAHHPGTLSDRQHRCRRRVDPARGPRLCQFQIVRRVAQRDRIREGGPQQAATGRFSPCRHRPRAGTARNPRRRP